MRTSLLSLVFLSSLAPVLAGPGTANPYGGRRAIVFGIDGCRADALKQEVEAGNAPNIAALVADGTVSWNATAGGWSSSASDPTRQDTMSGPGWASVCTGVWINKHGVSGNTFAGRNFTAYPHFFKHVKEEKPAADLASLVSWPEINTFIVEDSGGSAICDCHTHSTPGSYDTRDINLTAETVTMLQARDPDIIFHYQGNVDIVGHNNGFSPTVGAYLTAIRNADQRIGQVIAAVKARPQYAAENWIFVLTSDHGGTAGGNHGGQSVEERTIPFIVSGKSAPKGVYSGPLVGQVAVPATVMRHLGRSISGSWGLEQDGVTNGPVFTAAYQGSSVDLAWSLPPAGIEGLTGLELRRNGISIGTFPLSQTSFSDTAVAAPGMTSAYQLVMLGTPEAPLVRNVRTPGTGDIVWNDANSNNAWNTTDGNWTGGATFAPGNDAFFNGAGEAVTVAAGGVSPASLNLAGNGAYAFSGGPIAGSLFKSGPGVMTLDSANAFASAALDGGSITLGDPSALGSATLTVGAGAAGSASAPSSGTTANFLHLAMTGNRTIANDIVLPADTGTVYRKISNAGAANNVFTLAGILSGGGAGTILYLDNTTTSDTNRVFRLTGTNTFTGKIQVNRGSLQIDSNAALGAAGNPVIFYANPNSRLIFTNPMTYTRPTTLNTATVFDLGANDVTATGAIDGTSALAKNGAGALTLTANSTYAGTTTVNAGTLKVNGTLSSSSSAVNVAATATLTGGGAIQRPVTVNGTLAPGDGAAGQLSTTGTLTFGAGSKYDFQIASWNGVAGTGYDTVTANSVALASTSGSPLAIRVDASGLSGFAETTKVFVLASAASAPTGLVAGNVTVSVTGFTGTGSWSVRVSGNNLALVYTPAVAVDPFDGKRVLVIGIDGLRSDALKQQVETGHAPNIAALIAAGTVSWTAHAGGELGGPTQQPTISGPGWTSILTGMWTNRHQVIDNSSPPYNQVGTPGSYLVGQAPHFARRLKEAVPDATFSSVASWNWIEDYLVAAQPSWLDYHAKGSGGSYPARDGDVAAKATAHLGSANPDVLFLHFDQVDGAGHANGFSTSVPAYLAAIESVDGLVGNVLAAIAARPQAATEHWMVVLTTDHGGTSGGGHGGQSEGERTIPFIVSGGGVPVGVSVATPGHAAVPATVMRYFGLNLPAAWNLAEDGFVTGPVFEAVASSGTAQLSWSLPAAGIPGLTGVEIRRNGASIAMLPVSQLSYTDGTPDGGTNVYELVFTGAPDAPLSRTLFIPGPGQKIWDDANPNNAWNTTDANWSDATVFANGNDAYFTGAVGETVTVNATGVTPASVTVSGSGSYTFAGGSLLGGTLAKTGSGSLTLSVANAFTAASIQAGPDSQSAAAVQVGNFGALGAGAVTFGNTTGMTALYFPPSLGSGTLANPLALSSPSSPVTTRFLTDESNVTITLSGAVSGGNANQELLVDNDSSSNDVGKLRLTNAANSFTVSRLRINRGGLVVTSDGALGNAANGLALDVSSNLAGSGFILEGALTLGGGRALNVLSQTVIDTQATDDIVNGAVTYGAQLVKRGSGMLRLNGAGTGTAGMSLTEGSLSLGNAGALGTGPLNVATTAAAGFLDATNLPAVATVANAVVLPNDASATNRTVLMTAGAGKRLTLSGAISGGGSNTTLYLNTNASGDIAAVFELTGTNTFTGKVQLNRGSLSINSNASFGAAANAVTINANEGSKLEFTAPMTFTHPVTLSTVTTCDTGASTVDATGAIGGTAALTKTGSGTLVLSASNSMTGAVTVSAGTLRVNGSLAAPGGTVNVQAAGTLAGGGTVSRPVTVNGTLAPGAGMGRLAVPNTLTFGAGSAYAFQLADWNGAAGIGYDTVTANAVAVSATSAGKLTVQVDATGLTGFTETARSFALVSATSAPTGLAADNWAVNVTGFPGSGTWSLQTAGNQLNLVYTPVASGAANYATWAEGQGLAGGDAAYDADPDHDGVGNLLEFVLGTKPRDGVSRSLPALADGGEVLIFTFHLATAAKVLGPWAESSTSLAADSWQPAVHGENGVVISSAPTPPDGETVTVTIPKAGGERRFVRLSVNEP